MVTPKHLDGAAVAGACVCVRFGAWAIRAERFDFLQLSYLSQRHTHHCNPSHVLTRPQRRHAQSLAHSTTQARNTRGNGHRRPTQRPALTLAIPLLHPQPLSNRLTFAQSITLPHTPPSLRQNCHREAHKEHPHRAPPRNLLHLRHHRLPPNAHEPAVHDEQRHRLHPLHLARVRGSSDRAHA